MKKPIIIFLVVALLSAAVYLVIRTAGKDGAPKTAEKTPQKIKPVKSKHSPIPGVAPNTVVASVRWLDEKKLAVDFLINMAKSKPVFGVAINLSYNNRILKYLSYKNGDFLELGGESAKSRKPIYMVNKKAQENEDMVIIGAALFRGTPGVVGTGKLITLLFAMEKNLPTEIFLNKKKLKSIHADEITDIKWPDSIKIVPNIEGGWVYENKE